MICTRCGGTGFLNLELAPADVLKQFDSFGGGAALAWLLGGPETDVAVCDCCGDGQGWYGEAGQHYGSQDPPGRGGPYAYNGGLCECH